MLTEIVLDISFFSPNGSYTSPPPGQAVFAEILLGCCHFFLGHIYILVLDPNVVAGTVDSLPQRCAIGLSPSRIASSCQGWCDSGTRFGQCGPSPSSIPSRKSSEAILYIHRHVPLVCSLLEMGLMGLASCHCCSRTFGPAVGANPLRSPGKKMV